MVSLDCVRGFLCFWFRRLVVSSDLAAIAGLFFRHGCLFGTPDRDGVYGRSGSREPGWRLSGRSVIEATESGHVRHGRAGDHDFRGFEQGTVLRFFVYPACGAWTLK